MSPIPGIDMYRLLVRNQWRTIRRTTKTPSSVFLWLVLGGMVLYAVFILLVLGFYFDRFSAILAPDENAVVLVNRYLIAIFLSLFFVRFLFQQTPRMKLAPYLHLPVRKRTLVTFFQLSSLLSVHNFYPLLFFGPFWFCFVRPEQAALSEGLWILAIFAMIVGSHFGNLVLRSVLRQRAALFYPLLVLLLTVSALDELMGYGMTATLSEHLFSQILSADFISITFLIGVPVVLAAWSSLLLNRTLREPTSGSSESPVHRGGIRIPRIMGVTGQLLQLEILLMWRNRRPRHYLILSLVFSTMYLVIMMATENVYESVMFDGLIGLFASGGFVLNYGQLMFSWDSTHFDGLLARNVTFRQMVRAKLILLQASCLVLFVISLPLFFWLKPELISVHFAFLLYNAGVTSVLVMDLATRNSDRVDIAQSGSFFNYEGFSSKHWLWFIPTALPPTLFMIAVRDHLFWGLVGLATVGFISLLVTDLWTSYFSRALVLRKYKLAQGFRKHAR